jgi:5-methylcytosine-specific restriction endonuclease McrA
MDELDRWLDGLQVILALIAGGDLEEATRRVSAVPSVPYEKRRWRGSGNERREGPAAPASIREQVLQRDHCTCRYCNRRILRQPVAAYLSAHFPTVLPYSFNMPETDRPGRPHTHFGFIRTIPEIDHLVPSGGNGPENLVTACTPCNNYKLNRLLEDIPDMTLCDKAVSGWDGLYGLYLQARGRLPAPASAVPG